MSNLPSPFKSPKGEAEYMAAYEASMQLWTVPYEPMDISSRFGNTHLVVCGPKDAPPLVLLHCFFTSLTNWAYNIADLSRDYRVYALDMMGQPSKSIPDQPMSTREEMVEWLTGVLDALGIQQMDLIGYSYGGFVALNYTIHAPDRVKKLILITPAGGVVRLWKQFYLRGLVSALVNSFLPALSRWWMTSFLNWMIYVPNMKTENNRPLFDCMRNQMSLGAKYFRMGNLVQPLPFSDEDLRSVKSPTLLLIGQREAMYDPLAAIKRAKKLIPNIRAELIPNYGHELPNANAEMVDKRVLEFLKE